MMICTEGEAQIIDLERGEGHVLNKGTAIIIPASAGPYRIEGKCTVYKAAVPL
jgi:mannose-6-phosphate isomerase class I